MTNQMIWKQLMTMVEIERNLRMTQARTSGTDGNSPPFQRRGRVRKTRESPFRGRLKISVQCAPMSHTYCSRLYHCVFSTKERRPIVPLELKERLWPFMA